MIKLTFVLRSPNGHCNLLTVKKEAIGGGAFADVEIEGIHCKTAPLWSLVRKYLGDAGLRRRPAAPGAVAPFFPLKLRHWSRGKSRKDRCIWSYNDGRSKLDCDDRLSLFLRHITRIRESHLYNTTQQGNRRWQTSPPSAAFG